VVSESPQRGEIKKMKEEETLAVDDTTVIREGGKVYLKFRGKAYPVIEKERATPSGRYIVYPDGADSWSEIKETCDLLREEGKRPQIVRYKSMWNVEAERGSARKPKTGTTIITIAITWKGETISSTRESEWWDKVTKEDILAEIEGAIDGIGEE